MDGLISGILNSIMQEVKEDYNITVIPIILEPRIRPVLHPVKPKKTSQRQSSNLENKMKALDVRLTARSGLTDAKRMVLIEDTLNAVRLLLKQNQYKILQKFLSDAKHHLMPELNEMIIEEINKDKGKK